MAAAETLLILHPSRMPQDGSLGNGNSCCEAMPIMRPQTRVICDFQLPIATLKAEKHLKAFTQEQV